MQGLLWVNTSFACLANFLLSAGGHALVLGSGTGILGLIAAQLGARRVTCIEHGPMLYRVATQTLHSNRHITGANRIMLVDRGLQSCGIAGAFLGSLYCLMSQTLTMPGSIMCTQSVHSKSKTLFAFPVTLPTACSLFYLLDASR